MRGVVFHSQEVDPIGAIGRGVARVRRVSQWITGSWLGTGGGVEARGGIGITAWEKVKILLCFWDNGPNSQYESVFDLRPAGVLGRGFAS